MSISITTVVIIAVVVAALSVIITVNVNNARHKKNDAAKIGSAEERARKIIEKIRNVKNSLR